MKLAGMIFILASSFSVGLRIAMGLKHRCTYLRQFLHALQKFENEISFSATPLPEAFEIMAGEMTGQGKEIIENVSVQMTERRWTMPRTAMERSLVRFPDDLLGDILLELSSSVGKYDLQAQLSGIEQARMRADALLHTLEEERSIKSKTYETLSVCAGLAAAILLI